VLCLCGEQGFRHLQRQTRFADAAGTDQRQQTTVGFLEQQAPNLGHFCFTPNEDSGWCGKVVTGWETWGMHIDGPTAVSPYHCNRGRLYCHGGQKSIPPPPHRFHGLGRLRLLIERPPNFADARRQGHVTDIGLTPHRRNELLFGDQLPGVRHQIAQGRKGFAR
jgi:hypothetical protein